MMAGAIDQLLGELRESAYAPRVYGVNDCCVAIADLLEPFWQADAMARFRNRYTTARGFLRVMRKEGCASLLEAMALVAAEAGAAPVMGPVRDPAELAPRDLDLGMIVALEDREEFGTPAIFAKGCWYGLSPGGLAVADEAIAMWRHPAVAGGGTCRQG